MLIQCTRKLLDKLKVKPEDAREIESDSLFAWHANLLTTDRRNVVVLVNDHNRYVIVLYGLLAKDFKRLHEIIPEAIRTVFQEKQVKDEVIEQYLQHSPSITFTKTKDRGLVARMSSSIKFVVRMIDDLLVDNEMIQIAIGAKVSEIPVSCGDRKYVIPNQELIRDLEKFSGQSPIQTEAVQVKVRLQLGNHEVWRRLVIPLQRTFRQLHDILQRAFNWENSHLHEFYLYDDQAGSVKDNEWNWNHPAYNSEGKKPVLNIVSNEEMLHFGSDIPVKLDTEVKLADFLPKHKTIRYIYDFGDNWRHDLVIEKYIENYDKNNPVCLEGEGIAPPEDVGGEPGYEQFLEIINDQEHPEHQRMETWSREQGWSKRFDLNSVNFWIKSK